MTDVLLDGVEPSAKFYAEFGQGSVPLKYAAGWAECPSALEWFERLHSALDVLDALTIDLDELFELSHAYHEANEDPPRTLTQGNEPAPTYGAQRPIVERMMAGGLTLRQAARWLQVPLPHVVRLVMPTMPMRCTYEDVAEADELIWSGQYSNADVAKITQLHRNSCAKLRRLRSAA